MSADAWPPFHADPEHYPATHPGAIEDCPDCRPAPPNIVELALAAALDQTADMFDLLFPGSGAGVRDAFASAIPSMHAAMTYWIAGAATELDYYQGAPS